MTRRVASGIVYVIKHGLPWKDAPVGYGPHKTLYTRFICWSRMGVFAPIFAAFSREGPSPERIMIDATHLKAHRTAASDLDVVIAPHGARGPFPDGIPPEWHGTPPAANQSH